MSQANLIPRPAFWKVPDYTNDNHSHRASASAATASTPLPYTSQYQQHNNHQHHNPRQYQYQHQHHLRQNQPTAQQSQHMVKPVTGTGLRIGVTGSSPSSSSSYAPITSFNSSTVGSPRGLLKKHRNFGKSTKRVRFRDTVDEYDYHANPVEYKYQTPNPINVSEWMNEWIYPICMWACFPHTMYFEYSARSIAIPDVIMHKGGYYVCRCYASFYTSQIVREMYIYEFRNHFALFSFGPNERSFLVNKSYIRNVNIFEKPKNIFVVVFRGFSKNQNKIQATYSTHIYIQWMGHRMWIYTTPTKETTTLTSTSN